MYFYVFPTDTHMKDTYIYAHIAWTTTTTHKPYTYTQYRHAVDTSTVLLVAGGAVRWSVRIKHTCIMLYADTQANAVCDIVISRYNGRKRARACVAVAAAATQNVRCARIISSDTLLSILGHREDRAGFGFCWQVHKANARSGKRNQHCTHNERTEPIGDGDLESGCDICRANQSVLVVK